MAKAEQILEAAYDDVKNDVAAAIKAHPQYEQFLKLLAEKGAAELFALVSSAV